MVSVIKLMVFLSLGFWTSYAEAVNIVQLLSGELTNPGASLGQESCSSRNVREEVLKCVPVLKKDECGGIELSLSNRDTTNQISKLLLGRGLKEGATTLCLDPFQYFISRAWLFEHIHKLDTHEQGKVSRFKGKIDSDYLYYLKAFYKSSKADQILGKKPGDVSIEYISNGPGKFVSIVSVNNVPIDSWKKHLRKRKLGQKIQMTLRDWKTPKLTFDLRNNDPMLGALSFLNDIGNDAYFHSDSYGSTFGKEIKYQLKGWKVRGSNWHFRPSVKMDSSLWTFESVIGHHLDPGGLIYMRDAQTGEQFSALTVYDQSKGTEYQVKNYEDVVFYPTRPNDGRSYVKVSSRNLDGTQPLNAAKGHYDKVRLYEGYVDRDFLYSDEDQKSWRRVLRDSYNSLNINTFGISGEWIRPGKSSLTTLGLGFDVFEATRNLYTDQFYSAANVQRAWHQFLNWVGVGATTTFKPQFGPMGKTLGVTVRSSIGHEKLFRSLNPNAKWSFFVKVKADGSFSLVKLSKHDGPFSSNSPVVVETNLNCRVGFNFGERSRLSIGARIGASYAPGLTHQGTFDRQYFRRSFEEAKVEVGGALDMAYQTKVWVFGKELRLKYQIKLVKASETAFDNPVGTRSTEPLPYWSAEGESPPKFVVQDQISLIIPIGRKR